MRAAPLAATTEFFADKVMWLDSIWDAAHKFVRPVGGALLALAIVDPADPAAQLIAFLLERRIIGRLFGQRQPPPP